VAVDVAVAVDVMPDVAQTATTNPNFIKKRLELSGRFFDFNLIPSR